MPSRWNSPVLLILPAIALAGCSFFPRAGTDRARYCSDLLTADIHGYESLDEMAWYSEVIVVGTVSESQGSRWASDDPSEIVTDYTVEIDAVDTRRHPGAPTSPHPCLWRSD